MPSDQNPSSQDIEKMLEQARMKTVPPQILNGFKDGVMRRIAEERPVKTGSWVSPGWKLPRIGMTVGAGAFACLVIASIAVFTTQIPSPTPMTPQRDLMAMRPGAFEVASLPASGALTAPPNTYGANIAAVTADAPSALTTTRSAVHASAVTSADGSVAPTGPVAASRKLTVEEELRLIEEFDDQRFFIRQDITDDALVSA